MDISAILSCKFPDLADWEVVDKGDGQKITKWPKGVEKPTQMQLQKWWEEEVAIELERGRIASERAQRYRQETDRLLFDGLAKMDAPELAEWQAARAAIKEDLKYPKIKAEER
jgi:hypothetical protein